MPYCDEDAVYLREKARQLREVVRMYHSNGLSLALLELATELEHYAETMEQRRLLQHERQPSTNGPEGASAET